MCRATMLAALTTFLGWPHCCEAGDDIPLAGDTVVRFASALEGARALAADDAFSQALSRFDLQSRLEKGGEVTVDQWRDFTAAQALAWEEPQIAKLKESLARLNKQLARFELPLPDVVTLIRTSGKEEGSAAYTRGTSIILPDKVLARTGPELDRLLTHELFHILSRHQPMLRSELYAIVGFQTCPPIALPPSLADRKLTNPDAPLVDCTIELKGTDQTFVAAPVLYASAKEYDPHAGGSLFKYMTFRLMVVEKRDGKWQPAMKGDQAIVIDPKHEPAFFDKIGKNTQYIIHPDEILADNFVLLAMGQQNLATPRVVEQMGKILAKP
jgi:hypothetical protein